MPSPVSTGPAWLGLLLAMILGTALRLPGLETNPPGFFCDEASAGYDALSILETGADQYGHVLPLFAQSFGDWDEASYRYLVIPFVAVLGPTVLATRLPAALSGIALVALLFFLARRWFGDRAAIAVGLLAAINPWLIGFSRIGFRGILLPTAITAALLLTDRARTRGRGAFLAALCFAGALWTYSPARVLVPALLVMALLVAGRELWAAQRREVIAGALVFVIWLVVLASFWLSPEGMARAHSELRGSGVGLATDYASYFSYEFLFHEGDPNLRHSLRGWGQMLPFELVTISWGVIACIQRRTRFDLLVCAWALVGVLPAALTMSGHALRAIGAAPPLLLLSGLGVARAIELVRGEGAKRAVAVVALVLALVLGFVPMRSAVLAEYPLYASGAWQWGMREGIQALRATDRQCYVLSSQLFLPHIFILFFGDVRPSAYQARPISGITQSDMTYERFEIGPWRVLPIPAAASEARECAFLSLARERTDLATISGLRVVEELFGPAGEHYFDISVIDGQGE